ncbi:MAG TPA: ubiquinol-cytochrome c reductase iron-sulfur subunit [Terriglobia bacterium]|nr:ubiquinol-cytochrome c reductase iron-sulfur subunit [Terriglobia bacterium]
MATMDQDEKKPADLELPPAAEPLPPEDAGRRKFIGWVLGISGAVIAGLLSVPLIRLALYPVFAKSSRVVWSDLGDLTGYASLTSPIRRVIKIQKTDGWQQTLSEKVVYVTKGPDGKVRVLTAVCPHLGCDVAWNAEMNEFKCPCHGGTFAASGKYISGPPPRGMDTLPIEVEGGRLRVRYEYFRNLVPLKEVTG